MPSAWLLCDLDPGFHIKGGDLGDVGIYPYFPFVKYFVKILLILKEVVFFFI